MCNLHVVMHGCGEGLLANVVKNIGQYWGKYAASNNLIMLYPMIKDGCWDTYAYTGSNYATNEAIQPLAVIKMIQRITNKKTTS